jgi:hypothetical protein
MILSLYGKVVGGQIIAEAGVRCGRDLFGEVLNKMRTISREPPAPSASRAKIIKKAKKLGKK